MKFNETPKEAPVPIDLSKRIFVFEGPKFRTSDKTVYVRRPFDGNVTTPIRRQVPKMRGKAARRADKLARRAQ